MDNPFAQQVERLAGDNFFTHYNMGFIYLGMKEYDKARSMAHGAMALWLQKPGLRAKLIALGKWQEPKQSHEPVAASDNNTATPTKYAPC